MSRSRVVVQTFTEIGSSILGGQIGEVLVFFSYTKTNNINTFVSCTGLMWTELDDLMLKIRLVSGADVRFGVSMMTNHFWGFRIPKTRNFVGVNTHFKPILQKIKSPISSKLCIRLTQSDAARRESFVGGLMMIQQLHDGRHGY